MNSTEIEKLKPTSASAEEQEPALTLLPFAESDGDTIPDFRFIV